MSREVKPDPVPPPKEWKRRKPCSPEHCSDCFLFTQRTAMWTRWWIKEDDGTEKRI